MYAKFFYVSRFWIFNVKCVKCKYKNYCTFCDCARTAQKIKTIHVNIELVISNKTNKGNHNHIYYRLFLRPLFFLFFIILSMNKLCNTSSIGWLLTYGFHYFLSGAVKKCKLNNKKIIFKNTFYLHMFLQFIFMWVSWDQRKFAAILPLNLYLRSELRICFTVVFQHARKMERTGLNPLETF